MHLHLEDVDSDNRYAGSKALVSSQTASSFAYIEEDFQMHYRHPRRQPQIQNLQQLHCHPEGSRSTGQSRLACSSSF